MRYVILVLLVLTGCASLREKSQKIQEGDPEQKLIDVLGMPDSVKKSNRILGGSAYYYSSGDTHCGFTVFDREVKHVSCREVAHQSSGWENVARGMAAAGQSLNASMVQSNPNPAQPVRTTCHYEFGNYVCETQ